MNGFSIYSRTENRRLTGRFASLALGALIIAVPWIAGAATRDPAPPSIKPAKILIEPSSIALHGPDDFHGIIVTAITADGSTYDVTSRSRFTSKQPKLLEVSTNGLCHGLSDCETEVLVKFGGKSASIPVRASQTSDRQPPSFRQEVLPLLTRAGCNAGACHGKMAGQNGFRLSLRGFAPEWDYDWLVNEVHARRVDYAFPEESLLVQKPLGRVPHQGGVRFEEGSRAHKTIVNWIGARAPGSSTNEQDAVRLEILPGNRVMRVAEKQRLLVRAYYPDGEARDVTWLTQFFSNDETVAQVSPEGIVKCLRNGETAIRAHFQGLVQVMTVSMPYQNQVDPKAFVVRNNTVDQHVFSKLSGLRIPPSELCDDATFIRRAFLDAIGTLPTAEEVQLFVGDTTGNKRERLVDELLKRSEWVDYWTLQFADLLQNRKERDHDVRGTKGVRSFHAWLRSQIEMNRPWNELAKDVLTASGSVIDKPEIGYFITTVGEKKAFESEVTDSVAQAFLGTRVGCARCHNHPLEKYTQDDFYHFSAFFSRVSLKREEPGKGKTVLAINSREEEEKEKELGQVEKALKDLESSINQKTGEEKQKLEKKMAEQTKRLVDTRSQLEKLRSKMPTVTQPRTKKPMTPQPLDRSPVDYKPGEDPRELLADWMIDPKNASFSGAMINRLWKHFLGVGLVEPVDDLRASNPPSNRELWGYLSKEFVEHRYDVKHVMRLILNSRTYQLSSATLAGNKTERRFYSHYYARRLPAEVLLDAMSQSIGVPDKFDGYPQGVRAIQLAEPGVSSYFLTLFGRSDRVTACACER
ncbi:MAG TPA: DUF1549 and DUF1553 domain-containing protein, partial [Candidatus Saccharimonadales bacterium]|nr:DUF1549 and DUF1553 domain-containing protein [Candidatus Saccharimonadales bacterium]